MQERAREKTKQEQQQRHQMEVNTSPLIPLLQSLQHFQSISSLDARIKDIYSFLDCDMSGSLSKVELNEGLRRLALEPLICLSDDDWENITEREALCNENGELGPDEFMLVIKEQIKAQMMSQLVDSMAVADPVQVSIISVLKLFLSQTDPTTQPTKHHQDGGKLEVDELRAAMRKDDPTLTEAEIQQRIDDMDANHDGKISVREYEAWRSKSGNSFAAHMLPVRVPSWGPLARGLASQHHQQDADKCLQYQADQQGSSSYVSREELSHMLASMQQDTQLGVERVMVVHMQQLTTTLPEMIQASVAKVLGGGGGVVDGGGEGGRDSGRMAEYGKRGSLRSRRSQEKTDSRIVHSSCMNPIVTAPHVVSQQSQREASMKREGSINRLWMADLPPSVTSHVSANGQMSISRHSHHDALEIMHSPSSSSFASELETLITSPPTGFI